LQNYPEEMSDASYIGRLAPTPSGRLHKGHVFTFATAYYRARINDEGRILLRIEDLDPLRCKEQYVLDIVDDLSWLGLKCDPYDEDSCEWIRQSDRLAIYKDILRKWIEYDWVYPSEVSRKEISSHPDTVYTPAGEILFPESLRPSHQEWSNQDSDGDIFKRNWRWRVQYGQKTTFFDNRLGEISFQSGRDYGDFLIWSKDGYPTYEMAVVVDDVLTGITEVVRGEDLLISTARQLSIYDIWKKPVPAFFHCPLVKDENGVRLAKSYDSESIRSYREKGVSPTDFWLELRKFGMTDVADWYLTNS